MYSQNSCLLLAAEQHVLSLKLEMCVYVHICVYVCAHVYVHVCVPCGCVHLCVCVPCVCAWLHVCVHVCFVLSALSYVVLLY